MDSLRLESIPRRSSLMDFMNKAKASYLDPSFVPKTLKGRGPLIHIESSEEEEALRSTVLVLYSGGTIGMKSHDGVYSPEPDFLEQAVKEMPNLHDKEYARRIQAMYTDSRPLVMPLSKEGKRVIYYIYEYEPLLDSSNMTMTDYAKLASDIESVYDDFDAFVILHGTDTMAYTASALSFMLENLGKTVILTGSQIPIFEVRSDGLENFCDALVIAGHFVIPEVTICFNRKLLRGNRSTKIDSGSFEAFQSPNLPPLVNLEIDIHVDWAAIYRSKEVAKFKACLEMSPHVALLRLFPSITAEAVKSFLQPPMLGLVIESYGAGNGPDVRTDLLKLFKEATDRGVLLVNITQCYRGAVSASYAAGRSLLDAGILFGSDLTPEAALTKLAYVLAKKDWSFQKKREVMGKNIRGEMRVSEGKTLPASKSLVNYSLLSKLSKQLIVSSDEDVQLLKDTVLPSLMCAASRSNDIDTLEGIRKTEGNIFSMGDYDLRTPLHVAASEGLTDVVDYLLRYGASVHVKDRYGHTALDDAVRFNKHAIISSLRKAGAVLRVLPMRTAMLMCHAVATNHIDNLKSWILAGVDPNVTNFDKRTALHIAASIGNVELVEYLLSVGCNPNLEDVHGLTSIDEAKRNEHLKCLNVLLGKGKGEVEESPKSANFEI
ncbi:DgyrCDS10856 [Dimorphilus gyrociliatus]|uniref:asparaginase n=1 Tax=Dimorphilus gyrociliatus TaxID=2664684 RepID=A0A7I8W2M4_9ANNE|nr:DgyrCDS10856 [Dimorphilus gyrociliatus]